MEVVHSLENYNILFKGVTETIKNETKEQKGGFLRTLVGTLGLILLGNLLSGKGIYWIDEVTEGSILGWSFILFNLY